MPRKSDRFGDKTRYPKTLSEATHTNKTESLPSGEEGASDQGDQVKGCSEKTGGVGRVNTATDPGAVDQSLENNLGVVAINPTIPPKTYWQKISVTTTSPGNFHTFFRHSYQPAIILFTVPAVFYMSLVYGVTLAWQTVMVTVLSSYMTLPPYNFNSAQIGLMSVPPFIGTTIGALIIGPLSDRSILYLARRNKGIYEPEMRLWMMAPFVPFVPAGALMFGIGLNNGIAWPIIAVGYAICSVGLTPISSVALTYITDSYAEIVGDALVGVTFTRNIIGMVLVFALTPWVTAMGIKKVIIMITVIGTAVLSFVIVFIIWGKKFRVWTTKRYRYFSERQFEARRV